MAQRPVRALDASPAAATQVVGSPLAKASRRRRRLSPAPTRLAPVCVGSPIKRLGPRAGCAPSAVKKNRSVSEGTRNFQGPLPLAWIFPVPGYADGAGPSSPLASSNRRAGVAPAWAPRDATNLSRGVGAPVRVRAAGPRHAGTQLLMDQTKRDGDRREVISCVSAGGSPSFGGHMREAT